MPGCDMIKILSLDGGGIRGIIPAMLLAKMERRTGTPVSELFDLIAGTSTGGILALGLGCPDAEGRPRYTAADLAGLYEKRGADIFCRSTWRRFLPFGNLLDEKYPCLGIERVLEQYFGEIRLKDSLTDLMVTSYEIERRFPFFFRSRAARIDPAYDFPMKLVARATSAAPTYFEPLKIPASGTAGYFALVDGGVFANNPAMCALAEARRESHDEQVFLVSLGTGQVTRPIAYDKARHWGVARWAKPVLDVVFDGVSSTVDYQLRLHLPRLSDGRRTYYRFQPTLDPALEEMDNSDSENIRRLKLLAESTIRDREEELNELCDSLLTL